MNETFGAIVGRFQVHQLTAGHIMLINHVLSLHDKLIIFIGDRNCPPTSKNPLSFEVRMRMIQEYFPRHEIAPKNIIIKQIMDCESDCVWTNNLDNIIDELTGGLGATLYCGRDSFKPYYNGRYEIIEMNFGVDDVNATEIRNNLKNIIFPGPYFRAGIIHATMNSWHRQYHTVDMALIKGSWGHYQICLVRKPGQTQWQLPGGFTDKGEKYADAAAREMMEETGMSSFRGWEIVDDFLIEDWRTRGIDGVDHKTVLMLGWADNEQVPKADDDVEEAKFFPLDQVRYNIDTMIKKNHRELVKAVIHRLDTKH